MTVDGQPATAAARGAYVFVVWKNGPTFMAWHDAGDATTARTEAGTLTGSAATSSSLQTNGFVIAKVG